MMIFKIELQFPASLPDIYRPEKIGILLLVIRKNKCTQIIDLQYIYIY